MKKLSIYAILIFSIMILFLLYQQTRDLEILINKNIELERIIYDTRDTIENNRYGIYHLEREVLNLTEQLERFNLISLGTFEITAYTEGFESCGKLPSHPEYGITASGNKVKENHTIAADKSVPFGTKLMIEGLPYVYTVKDRGGAIKGQKLDIYMENVSRALEWGRRERKVWEVIQCKE